MTIPEAVAAARKNAPVVYDDKMLGEMLFARIGAIRKDFARLADVERGRDPEFYQLELLPMAGGSSVTVVDPERVRVAQVEDLRDMKKYRRDASRPGVTDREE